MPLWRVERNMAPVVFYVEAADEAERDDMLSEIYGDPHVGGQIADWEDESKSEAIDPEAVEAVNEDTEWIVFWDDEDQRYVWR